ncbi:glycosyl transferase family 2 [Leptolyngbya sp. NIES-3755]|nr:glycosyl transferase family 2 [Leptolyngbya sp. NIES-3755]
MNVGQVSVIVPVYNAEQYIEETLRSLFSQTYENFEVIIVDDGSPDNSIALCRQFDDPRLKIVQQKNRGLPGARNTGIRHAQGEYLSLLDADDLWLPEKLEKHVKHLQASPKVGVSFSYSVFIDEQSRSMGLYQMPRKIRNITPPYVLCRNPVGNGSAAVIRRETFEDIKFQDDLYGVTEDFYFDERLRFEKADATDLECWTRIAATTKWQLEGIPEALTLYRINAGGLSANAMIQYRAIEKVIEKSCKNSPEVLGAYEQLAKAYYMRYVARRAVTLRDGEMAVETMNTALSQDIRILFEEPRRTLITMMAAYSLKFTPRSLYTWMERAAFKVTGATQKQRISEVR